MTGSGSTNFQTIRRGPFGGDQYTQVHNLVFRGAGGLTLHESAVLGHVSTHRPGWGTSARTIAEEFEVSESTIRRALQGLKAKHYVVQGQEQGDGGRFGEMWMFVTDLPAQLAAMGITDPELIERRVREALDDWLAEHRESAGHDRQPHVTAGLSCGNTRGSSAAG